MALKRYHVNPDTGQTGLCVAVYRCRFGANAVHYPSEADARMGYERRMERIAAKATQRERPGVVTEVDPTTVRGNQFDLEAGTYFIGDPYLTIGLRDQAGWNAIVKSVEDQFGWENDVVDPTQQKQAAIGAAYDDRPVMALKSYHGDGLHWSLGPTRRIPSETGLVGFVSEQTMTDLGFTIDEAETKRLGMRVDLDRPTTVWRDENGVMVVGGKLLVCHNDLIQSHWFESLNKADGVNEAVATAETYSFLTERALLWKKDPALAAK